MLSHFEVTRFRLGRRNFGEIWGFPRPNFLGRSKKFHR